MARIGVYGGSFNPPHLGHIFAARKARQLLGLDKNNSCSYTNSGTATISDTELQELLHTKGLPFPNGIVGQRIKILSNLEMQKEQAQADILQKLSSNGEELNIDG